MSALPAGSPLVGSRILAAGRIGGGPTQVLDGSDALWGLGWWTSTVVGVLVATVQPSHLYAWLRADER